MINRSASASIILSRADPLGSSPFAVTSTQPLNSSGLQERWLKCVLLVGMVNDNLGVEEAGDTSFQTIREEGCVAAHGPIRLVFHW